jgi:hypothetical protein
MSQESEPDVKIWQGFDFLFVMRLMKTILTSTSLYFWSVDYFGKMFPFQSTKLSPYTELLMHD